MTKLEELKAAEVAAYAAWGAAYADYRAELEKTQKENN
jgi:hypothetical protein